MLRLGVIGYGNRMRSVLATLARFEAGARVVARVDPRAAALRQQFPDPLDGVVAYDDAERMLDEARLDGVLVGTRCSLHTPYAIAVLRRDLPLFLEKPVATSWEQAAALDEAGRRSRSPVVVSFPLRVSRIAETVRQIIDAGTIGQVGHVQAVNNVPYYSSMYDLVWMRDFLAVLTGRGRSRAPLEAGIQSVRLCLAARDSCRLGAFREIAPLSTPIVGAR